MNKRLHKNQNLTGNAGLIGDATGLIGDATGLIGDATGLIGDLDTIEISEWERTEGLPINELAVFLT